MVNKKTIATFVTCSEHAPAYSSMMGTAERRMDAFLAFAFALLSVYQGIGTYEMDFPCEDSTWTYVVRSGKCYKLFSDTLRYTQKEALDNCRSLLVNYPDVRVTVAEVRDSDDLRALKQVLVESSLKERVFLNARRENTNKPFMWQSDNTVVNLDFMLWSGGVGDGNCLTAFYTAERVGLRWKTVAVVEEDACDTGHAVICEHKVKDCENPPGGFNPSTMQFMPTRPHPGTTTTVVCKPGFYPRLAEKSSKIKYLDADNKPPLAEFKCAGQRANPGVADPSQYKATFSYNGLPLNECDGKEHFTSNHIRLTARGTDQ
ncbi:hypothetical protein TSMEX_008053 [Taenia solium]|eukprot:TsM_000659000 transcript=TsM_000659000 gene=TsM_000659000